MKKTMIVLLFFCLAIESRGQNRDDLSPVIFIYDASGSMWGQIGGKSKMEIASEVLTDFINNLPENQNIGFVAYGHRNEGDCEDVEFLVDVEGGTKPEVIQSIKGIKPLGKTPLAFSALQVIEKLRQTKLSATIILVTDGIESCDGNICEVIKAAKDEGIDFQLHIIGLDMQNEDTEQLKCAAEAGGGNYYSAMDASGLAEALEGASVDIKSQEPNFSVYAVKNGVAIDAWVRAYDIISKRQPISVRTYKDTAFFYLPPSNYNFEVTPLGGSDVDMITVSNLVSFEDKMMHQTIAFDGGKVKLFTTNNGENWDCMVKIIDQNGKVAASERTYNTVKEVEVNPGSYKVSVQALKMEGMDTYAELDSIKIQAGSVTPVTYDFKTGNFDIFTKVGSDNIDAVITINEVKSGKNVAGARTYTSGAKFVLNPGTYEVKAQPLGDYKEKEPQTVTIEVKQGELATKELKF